MPIRYELFINFRSAMALGVNIPIRCSCSRMSDWVAILFAAVHESGCGTTRLK
jgi:hypothetical protein